MTRIMQLVRILNILLFLFLFTRSVHANKQSVFYHERGCHSSSRCTYSCKYGSSRTQYYSNTVATFQLLWRSGDVDPNPGPSLSTKNDDQPGGTHSNTQHLAKSRIQYDTASLQRLNPPHHVFVHQRLPCKVWKTITDLGFGRSKKTRRSKNTIPKLKSPDEITLTTLKNNLSDNPLKVMKKGLKISHLNIYSVLPKISDLNIPLENRPIDIFTLSESHLDDTVLDLELSIDGYKLERVDRNRRGGGVGVYLADHLMYSRRFDFESREIETLWIELKFPNTKPILIGTYYRPPRSNVEYNTAVERYI